MRCSVCGNGTFRQLNVLWRELIEGWELTADETRYINEQQGLFCLKCNSNLRSISLADALLKHTHAPAGMTFVQWVQQENIKKLKILEINHAGTLHRFLSLLPHLTLAEYPQEDMQKLSYPSESFDFVLHSDTLEHVPDPIVALSECKRVLTPKGACLFTVPLLVDKLSRDCTARPFTYHGRGGDNKMDYRVFTEFGIDTWKYVIKAGFTQHKLHAFKYPSAFTHICQK